MNGQEVFERTEKKYLLDQRQYEQLLLRLEDRLLRYEFSDSLVHSLYLDNASHQSVRESMQAENYKEKIRLRAYGENAFASTVFFELKKKYNGIVYKRRISMSPEEMRAYLRTRVLPVSSQVMKEIDYACKRLKDPSPAILITYDRQAFLVKGEEDMRITFDRNVRYRDHDFFEKEGKDTPILQGKIILEIKIASAIPLWMTKILNELKIYPTSSSKYATAYLDMRQKEEKNVYIGNKRRNESADTGRMPAVRPLVRRHDSVCQRV